MTDPKTEARAAFLADLDARATVGRRLRLWLRDDDAVRPTTALDRLLAMAQAIPLTLAVIPAPKGAPPTGTPLADRLAKAGHVTVATHGWSHQNHAGEGEKSQELGAHRPADQVLAELAEGHGRLAALHGSRALPLLVPPWNRIDAGVLSGLPGIGFTALSTFGTKSRGVAGLAEINTHLDIIDWHGTRGGRPAADLWAELRGLAALDLPAVGVLTHHLVHDQNAWSFLGDLIAQTKDHPGAEWIGVERLMA